jgi:4-amino-4-deoxy-L-arabinose transferase-like glycosyltransferase
MFLVKLGTGALLDWDEAIYAEVSKEIVLSHHWLTLTWQHQPFFEKPPLSFWIEAVFFRSFGVTEFWARFASALAGIAIVLLTYAIARRLAGVATGLLAALVLLTTNHFDRIMREGTTDALLCLCIYLSVYAYLRLREEGLVWFYLLCATVGLGVMVKGPAILIAPFAIGLDWFFRRREKRLIGWRDGSLGALLTLVIVAPWHIWMVAQYGRSFLHSYVGYQLAQRFTGTIEGSGGGPLYYVQVIGSGAFPWSVLALIAAAKWLWRRQWRDSLLWELAVLVLLYSFLPTKHPWYIIPIYPALSIEVGRLLAEVCKERRAALYATVTVLVLGLGIAFVRLAMRQGDPVDNQMRQLATVAERSPASGSLFVITTPDATPEIDIPAAIFYSSRNTTLAELPADGGKLDQAVRRRTSVDVILQKSALLYLSRQFTVHPVAQSNLLLYGVISRKP